MDPAAGIGIPVAFGAGLISFLSPCVLPLVPGYLSSVAGVKNTAELTARRVIGPSLAFIGTFSAIFIALGLLGQQALRGVLTGATARQVSGAIVVLMGLLFVLSPFIPRIAREWRVQSLMDRAGESGPVLTGVAFAIAWTPCQGPTLGAIVAATGTSSSAFRGAFLLAVYCLGLGVPFLITGLAFGQVTTALNVIKRHYPLVIGTGGVVLIGMGVLIWTDQFAVLNQHVSHWLSVVGLPNFNADT
ncbi:MAG TPA: cytochrome c biogenesis CcdA family protein [Solirubrobacteraceae bacterium]|nr:cytochrome c biogenesis CcdA family protein [Solirubrobacteraceae bacterium]